MRLRELRQQKNATQKEVADQIGCTAGIYSRYEKGERQPSIDMLIKMSEYFNASIDYIVANPNRVTGAYDTLSEYEVRLVEASRKTDDRAREDALRLMEGNRVDKE